MSDADDGTTESRDGQYSEVSLRAVELLARAQRTADEAVAEAQAYARDLEASARAQYGQILQAAQVAARDLTTSRSGGDATTGGGAQVSSAMADEVDYVRTYARVAHAQVRTVLTALTDELDRLAEVAAGRMAAGAGTPAPPAVETSWPAPPARVPTLVAETSEKPETDAQTTAEPSDDGDSDDVDADVSAFSAPRAATSGDGPSDDVWTMPSDDASSESARPTGWRAALQRKG